MDIKKLQRAIVDGLEDVKGQNIVVFDTEHLSSLFERVIIASGTSNRQTKALASSVRDAVKKTGQVAPRVEGEENGEWIIVDCGAAVVHLMQPNIREYYHLEEIWGDKPVKIKLDSAPKRLVKAEEVSAPAAVKKPAARKSAVKADADADTAKAPARKAAAKKAAPKVSAPPAEAPAKRRVAAPKPAAPGSRAAPAKSGVTRTVGVKAGSPTAKTPAKKSTSASRPAPAPRVARKAAIKTVVINKPTPRKSAAAKSPAKPGTTRAPARKAPRSA